MKKNLKLTFPELDENEKTRLIYHDKLEELVIKFSFGEMKAEEYLRDIGRIDTPNIDYKIFATN